jgi:hypothetical protein
MPTLADLHRSVQTALASKRLGTPVFVRYLLQTQDKPAGAVTRLAQIAGAVRDWLGQVIERVYAIGPAKSGHVTLTMEFRGGATAQISWTACSPRAGGVDLMMLGNHGALYHDFGTGNLWDEVATPLADKPDEALVALIERALRSGQSENPGGAP